MKYTLEVEELVNVGPYEHVKYRAVIEFDEEEAEGDPAKFGLAHLDVLLRSHRRRAATLIPEDSTSFILDHPALEN